MEFSFTPAEDRFRQEARDWLQDHVPKQRRPPRGPELRAFDLAWQKAKYEAGFGAIAWPKDYGGRELTAVEQMIWYEELSRAKGPPLGCLGIALNHAGPTIMAQGTPEQKQQHLGRILRGEVVWCQGFSEPGSGSDLASLRLSAVIDGDDLVLNGQKIWTSFAQYADFQETLVRTDNSGPKHHGITWIILDMKTPGLDVRPIRTIAGDEHFNEVFYDNVRVPMSNIVGGVNNGWKVAMTTLTNERAGITASQGVELGEMVEQLIALARLYAGNEEIDPALAPRLAWLRARAAAMRSMGYSVISRSNRNQPIGVETTLPFLYFGELQQQIRALALEILGGEALEFNSKLDGWVRGFLADRMYVIAGGTAEVRRNIIAERMLGLPKSQ